MLFEIITSVVGDPGISDREFFHVEEKRNGHLKATFPLQITESTKKAVTGILLFFKNDEVNHIKIKKGSVQYKIIRA